MAKKKVEDMTTQDLTTLLTMTLSKVMDWMPLENISKAILVPDPRDLNKLCAVHNGPDGITLLIGEGYKEFIEEMLCDDCKAQLQPYSVIYTGMNVHTGEIDPNSPIGLYGAHDEDFGESDGTDDEEDFGNPPTDLSRKRTLN